MEFEEAVRTVIRLVPHWYEADCGPETIDLRGKPRSLAPVRSLNRPTPALQHFRDGVEELENVFSRFADRTDTVARMALEEHFVERWLTYWSDEVNWKKFLAYSQALRERTYENDSVAMNLIIDPAGSGQLDLTRSALQKLLDPLANSPHTFLLVDGDFRLIEYCEVVWTQVNEPRGHQYYPEFIHPIAGQLQGGQFSVHQASTRPEEVT